MLSDSIGVKIYIGGCIKIMKPFKYKLIAVLLIFFILSPVFISSFIPLAHSADVTTSSNNNTKSSWLKGILLIILSYIINNYVEEYPKESGIEHRLGSQPLKEENVDNNFESEKNSKREVLGFYVNWLTNYSNSYHSLQKNHNKIDMVAPFWYTVNPDGSIESRYGGHQYEVTSLAQNKNLKVLPLINNNQKNNMILVNPETRNRAITNIVNLVNRNNYQGVNIDFENIPSWTRDGYTKFIKNLSHKLNKHDKILTISVFPKIDLPLSIHGAYDYEALNPYIDKMVIMTYDNHWSTGSPGPISPLPWVEDNIIYALEYIPPQKLLLGIANYGYDWPANGIGKAISTKKAIKLAQKYERKIKWDQSSHSPYFNYWDSEGIKHDVWFENSYSLKYKLNLVNKYNLGGIGIWRLGNATNKFWEMIKEKIK